MAAPQAGPIERWSGKVLRTLLAFVAGIGVGVSLWVGVRSVHPTAILWGGLLAIPYLIVRYRDPESSTVPLWTATK